MFNTFLIGEELLNTLVSKPLGLEEILQARSVDAVEEMLDFILGGRI
jgi:hypothetical protein